MLDAAGDLRSYVALWRDRAPERWPRTPDVYRQLSERIIKLGEPLIGYDVVAEGLRYSPGDLRLRQLQALALARSKATQRARELLTALQCEGHRDAETLGILARTIKDEWETATAPAERNECLRRAAEAYAEAYEKAGGYYTGINAATLALLLDKRDRATVLAREVRQLCRAEMDRIGESTAESYWAMATLGEAALILGEIGADQLETELIPLAVWDHARGDGPGGTAAIVRRWRELGYEPDLINLADLLRQHGAVVAQPSDPSLTPSAPHPARRALPFAREIRAMLFADAVGYGKLTEEQLPLFVPHFLEPLAEITRTFGSRILSKRTGGDNIFAVFTDVTTAGEFALAVRDRFHGVRWADFGLPASLGVRVGLDVGPVYAYMDPVVDRPEFCGAHVNRAARIEPITPPGHIFASQSFAALVAAQRVDAFVCEYAGLLPLPKDYGTFPLYHVRHRAPVAH